MNYYSKLAASHRVLIFIWVFLLVLGLFPLTANPVKPVKELASALVVFALALSLLAWPSRPGAPWDWERMPLLLLAGVWLLWGGVCALFSEFRMAGIDEMRVLLTWLLVALFTARVFREPRHVHQLFLMVCLAVFLSSVYGLFQYLGYDIFPWSDRDIEEYRGLPSTYANPNFAGHTLILALIVGGGLALAKSRRWVLLPMVLIAAHLYETGMRGAPLALAAGFVLLGCAWFVNRSVKASVPVKLVLTLGAVGVLGLAGVLALMPLSKARTGFYFPTDGSLILRYNGYHGAARMVADHPVMGVGPGNFGRKSIAYWTPYEKRWFADQQKRNTRVHNDLLESAVESGIPGLALHIALFMALLVRSLSLAFGADSVEKRRIGYTLAVFFMAFLVDGLFGFNLRVPVSGGLFFLMAGVLQGICLPVPQDEMAPAVKKKKRKGDVAAEPVMPDVQPRVFSSLLLSGAAFLCVVLAGLVFVGEMYYQRGNGMRLAAERTANPLHQAQALKIGETALSRGRSLVFWDERYADMLGHIAMRGGDAEAAIGWYSEALASDPHHPHKASNLARAYLSHALRFARDETQPDYDQVAALLETARYYGDQAARYCAVSSYVQDVRWRIARAEAVLAEEQGRDATPEWQRLAEKGEESLAYGTRDVSGIYRALGMAYVKLEQFDDAVTALAWAVGEDPAHEPTWSLLETAVRESGDSEPLLDLLHGNYAILAGQGEEKEDAFVTVVRRLVNTYDGIRADGPVAMRFARHGLARAAHRSELWALFTGLSTGQGTANTVCREATAHARRLGDVNRLPEFIRMACAERGTGVSLGEASRELAREAMQNIGRPAARDFGGAADFLRERLELLALEAQREAEIRANLATVYLEAGRWEEANRHFAFAIEKLPENARGRLTSAQSRAVAELGRHDEAMDLISQAIQAAPNDPLVQLTYARHLRRAGRLDEAAFAFTAAINALPEQSPLRAQAQRELQLLRRKKETPDLNLES